MYLHSRLLLITGFQVEMVYQELVNKPEVKELLSQAAGFREISERYADLLANFPARMAESHRYCKQDDEACVCPNG
jgi:hypothetical protein